eukprot:m.36574 g.36574  ORF g.36574 m.36574 type:complete len:94 (+) comp44709_c0_seq1:10-291(+)
MDSLRRNINSLVISLVHINNPRHAQASRFRSIRYSTAIRSRHCSLACFFSFMTALSRLRVVHDPHFVDPRTEWCSFAYAQEQLFKNFGMKDCF